MSEVADGAAPPLDGGLEHLSHREGQSGATSRTHLAGGSGGDYSRPVQRFIGVDVADPGRHRLIQERDLDRDAAALQGPMQQGTLEAERVGPQSFEPLMAGARLEQDDPAEPTRIAKVQLGALPTELQRQVRVSVWNELSIPEDLPGHPEV